MQQQQIGTFSPFPSFPPGPVGGVRPSLGMEGSCGCPNTVVDSINYPRGNLLGSCAATQLPGYSSIYSPLASVPPQVMPVPVMVPVPVPEAATAPSVGSPAPLNEPTVISPDKQAEEVQKEEIKKMDAEGEMLKQVGEQKKQQGEALKQQGEQIKQQGEQQGSVEMKQAGEKVIAQAEQTKMEGEQLKQVGQNKKEIAAKGAQVYGLDLPFGYGQQMFYPGQEQPFYGGANVLTNTVDSAARNARQMSRNIGYGARSLFGAQVDNSYTPSALESVRDGVNNTAYDVRKIIFGSQVGDAVPVVTPWYKTTGFIILWVILAIAAAGAIAAYMNRNKVKSYAQEKWEAAKKKMSELRGGMSSQRYRGHDYSHTHSHGKHHHRK